MQRTCEKSDKVNQSPYTSAKTGANGKNDLDDTVLGVSEIEIMNTKTAIITIAGRPNVGKSTLTNHLVGEKITIVSNKPQTTRNRICGVVSKGDTQFVFVDTPGYHKPRTKLGEFMVNSVKDSIADVDLTLLMVEPIASVGAQEQMYRPACLPYGDKRPLQVYCWHYSHRKICGYAAFGSIQRSG